MGPRSPARSAGERGRGLGVRWCMLVDDRKGGHTMVAQYPDFRFPTFAEYVEQQASSGLSAADGTPLYAHPMDEWILRSLNAAPVKRVLDRSIDTLISVELGPFLSTGIFIDQK